MASTRSAVGDQAHQQRLDGTPRSVQKSCDRSGDDSPERGTRSQSSIHHPQVARSGRAPTPRRRLELERGGFTGVFSGGTEFTPQGRDLRWRSFSTVSTSRRLTETRSWGSRPRDRCVRNDGYKITYYAPAAARRHRSRRPRRRYHRVDYGETGRVRLTTLTKEFFVPGFLERDEGEREPPTMPTHGTESAA